MNQKITVIRGYSNSAPTNFLISYQRERITRMQRAARDLEIKLLHFTNKTKLEYVDRRKNDRAGQVNFIRLPDPKEQTE